MDRRDFAKLALGLGAGSALTTTLVGPAAAQAPTTPAAGSNLDRVLSSKTLRVAGLVGEEPYFSKNLASGEWSGFCIDMARDIAKELGAKLEIVESTWGNSVLDLQTNKIDISFGLNPTPKRALVVDFTRPLFHNTFAIVARNGFSAQTWSDLNRPDARIAVDIGSTHELIARRYAGKATITGFKTRDEALLAVVSGRADCFVCTIFLGLTSKKKNPQLGNFIMPRPYVQSDVSAAIQYDVDRRFRDFLAAWCDFNRNNGQIREWIVANLAKVNIVPEDVPPEVTF
jgi:polar amino acid transport system substrate-binding protein